MYNHGSWIWYDVDITERISHSGKPQINSYIYYSKKVVIGKVSRFFLVFVPSFRCFFSVYIVLGNNPTMHEIAQHLAAWKFEIGILPGKKKCSWSPNPRSPKRNMFFQRYCWWKKSCTSWYMVVFPTIYRVWYMLGSAGFLASTVVDEQILNFHQVVPEFSWGRKMPFLEMKNTPLWGFEIHVCIYIYIQYKYMNILWIYIYMLNI